MKTGKLRARQRLTLKEAGEIVRESFGGRWYEVHEVESFEPRKQAVALVIEAIEAGSLLAEITARTSGFPGDVIGAPDPAKSTVATVDLLAWLAGITPAPTAEAELAKVDAGETANEENSSDRPLENWKMRVQEEATKRWLDQRALGCNPNPHSLKDELAKWCKDNKIFTKGNINPSPDYLYRHVLSSRHWAPPTD